jgi:hypothetical protein
MLAKIISRRGPTKVSKDKQYTIETDGRVVWVNSPVTLLGRFSKMGIDVHVNSHCVGDSCSPGPCSLKEWREFQEKMIEHHGIEVPDKYMPKFLET